MWRILFLLIAAKGMAAEMKQISERPLIYVIKNFLSERECDYLISYARAALKPSRVADEKTAQNEMHEGRKSQNMWCSYGHGDPVITQIEERIATLTGIPYSHGENIQVVHYTVGGEYKPHYDYFNPDTKGGAIHCQRGGQRKASFLMYLNTPEKGGETVFPGSRIAITPIKGDALLFYNTDSSGQVDPSTLHGGAPVLAGEKWLATRWLRERPFE